ncbi:uncharacterized protein FTOL_08647 [Fusarium torulosum]|uniref:DNA/RNA-binding domain-containing protein n=1 Tax=Fusarium torulosum TaxID=33205 RepID=A0AAE8MEP5_9HYPO|nr:uncharacterized protein FTOL_08647 [Fusarium torulosum]
MGASQDKLVRRLRTHERQGNTELRSITCDISDSEIKSIEAWQKHAQSDDSHKQQRPTAQASELYVQGANKPNSQDSSNRKRRADTNIRNGTTEDQSTLGAPVEEDQDADEHQDKRQKWAVSLSSPRRGPATINGPTQQTQPTTRKSPQPSSNDNDSPSKMVRQPETRPISEDQLVAEVKGIYADLVKVENKCIEVDTAQSSNADENSKLNNEQWQALIALHRTLLHEYHDFFHASQHPSASPALRSLASEYAMPARMWNHGIRSFLELLRHRLPASLEHMLTFLYFAYGMTALLYETVPAFEDIWIECLGKLGRYRMAIEDGNIQDREIWTGVIRYWYSKAAAKSLTTGKLYHHLAILARPNVLQQPFSYSKSLFVPIPFLSARESIMTLFDPVLRNGPLRLAPGDAAFVCAHGILFSGKSRDQLEEVMETFNERLDGHIARSTKRWWESGLVDTEMMSTNLYKYYIGISLACSLLGYGAESNVILRAIPKKPEETDVPTDGSTISEATPDETDANNPLIEAIMNYECVHVKAYIVHVDMVLRNEVAYKLTKDTIEALTKYHQEIHCVDAKANTYDWTDKEQQWKKLHEGFVQDINKFVLRAHISALEGLEEGGAGEPLCGKRE